MTAVFPSSTSAFVPSHEASGKLVVDYSRNPSAFAIARYCQYIPAAKPVGYYMAMTVEQAGRVLESDLRDWSWADGDDAPEGHGELESFEFLQFSTKRFAPSFRIGDRLAKNASWDILAQHGRIFAQRMMTGRTAVACAALQTTGNWGTHTSAVSSISGVTGKWDVSTTARSDIKRSLHYAAEQVLKDTLAAVDPSNLILVLSPGDARAISVSQEIVDYIKGSPDALAQVRGEGRNAMFGLPDRLYGYEVVVEATVKVTNKKGATRAVSYCCADASPFMVSRPGELEGVANSPNFSSAAFFIHNMNGENPDESIGDLGVEYLYDAKNRLTRGRIVDDWDFKVISPISGFLFTAATG